MSHYCDHLLCGKVDGNASPIVNNETPSVVLVDAKNGFAHTAFMAAVQEFVHVAREQGIACLAIRNSYAAGVIGWYVEKLAKQGLVALAFANSPPAIAPWGGTKAFFGTNPLAFAIPRADKPPLIIDQSSSVTAKVNLVQAANAGKSVPETWALDDQGLPTTDAKAGLKGSMAPAGGYKGVAMAMIVDLLAGGLAGPNLSYSAPSFGDTVGGPPGVGQLFIGFAPEKFGEAFLIRSEEMLGQMCMQHNVRLPGDRRHQHRAEAEERGVWIHRNLHQKLTNYSSKIEKR